MKKNNYAKEIIKIWYRQLKAIFQLSWALIKLSRLQQPIVSVFGGKGAYEEGKFATWAQELSKKLAEKNMSVITGGGPGIMEAASCGGYNGGGKKAGFSLGIGLKGVDIDFASKCSPLIRVDTLASRKHLLIYYSTAFVLFPGGIGTLDEFFEVLNLIKLNKIPQVPVILIGVSYWKDLIEWYEHAVKYEFITVPAEKLFVITDDLDEVVRIISDQ